MPLQSSLFTFLYIGLTLGFSYCTSHENKTNLKSTDSLLTTKLVDPLEKRAERLLFDKDQPFEIISAERGLTTQSSSPDTNDCKGWTIPKDKLVRVIKNSEYIDGVLWHHSFDVLPCIIEGELRQREQLYQFEMNSGSWAYIRCADTALLLGNFKDGNEKYFLSAADKE